MDFGKHMKNNYKRMIERVLMQLGNIIWKKKKSECVESVDGDACDD